MASVGKMTGPWRASINVAMHVWLKTHRDNVARVYAEAIWPRWNEEPATDQATPAGLTSPQPHAGSQRSGPAPHPNQRRRGRQRRETSSTTRRDPTTPRNATLHPLTREAQHPKILQQQHPRPIHDVVCSVHGGGSAQRGGGDTRHTSTVEHHSPFRSFPFPCPFLSPFCFVFFLSFLRCPRSVCRPASNPVSNEKK